MGARGDDDGGTERGAIYILFLKPDGTVKGEQKISSATGGLVGPLKDEDKFGKSLASLGDFNGDGMLRRATCASQVPDCTLRRAPLIDALRARCRYHRSRCRCLR